jgi:hypothetical protein
MKIYTSSVSLLGIESIGENPLPYLRNPNSDKECSSNGTLLKEDMKGMGKDIGERVLPYRMQDRYTRQKKIRSYKTVVMDNGILRAEFLADFGGRLRSLKDLRNGRELLFANPAIQPGNLAIRNAWLSGGIEWNIGQVGHTFTTCSPVFFAKIEGKGTPKGVHKGARNMGYQFLRLYEYERQKKLFWQIDFHLPDGSPFLQAHVRIINDQEKATPMYWWTNIAATEVPETRVFSSTKEALYNDSRATEKYIEEKGIKNKPGALRKMPIFYGRGRLPYLESGGRRVFDFDGSIPRNIPRSIDFFFQTPEDVEAPWESTVNPDGFIFFQRNSQPLRFNKMFCWGKGRGGRFWCDFLSLPGQGDYLEIQAGLAPSQLHGFTMPAKSEIHFTQFFGSIMEKNIKKLYAPWDESREIMSALMDKTLPAGDVSKANKIYEKLSYTPVDPANILHTGSGWGALETARRAKAGETVPESVFFPESTIAVEQLPWLKLLEKGSFPADPGSLPVSYMIDTVWAPLLKKAAAKEGPQSAAAVCLGVLYWENREFKKAIDLWQKAGNNPLAVRNLAYAASWNDDTAAALSSMEQAFDLEKGKLDQAFAEEYLKLLISAKDYKKAWKVYTSLPPEPAKSERIRIYAGLAAVEIGEYAYLDELFKIELSIIREGETSLTDIWFKAEAQKLAKTKKVPYSIEILEEVKKTRVPPANIDFRMSGN